MLSRLHERIGDWLLKQEDEARVGSHKRFVLDRAYESYLLKESRYYIFAAFIIYLVVGLSFNELLVWLLCTLFFLVTGVIILLMVSQREMDFAESYVKDYVDRRLWKGQFEKMMVLMHSRKENKR